MKAGVSEAAAGVSRPEPSVEPRVKVLYVAGWGRSGSTILGRILGQFEGFVSVGELRYIWDRGIIEDRLCGCGERFSECEVWREVSRALSESGERATAEELVRLREGGLRTRHLLLSAGEDGLRRRVDGMERYVSALGKLYRTVRETSGSRVVVDTSKFPSYGYVLRHVPGVEVYVLHLVRDPRAVAFSWASRRKPKLARRGETARSMTPHGLLESSLVWDEWNLVIETALGRNPERYTRLRYEDFVADPRGAVDGVLRFLGEEGTKSPFLSEREVRLDVSHTFSGNPDRFASGTATIAADEGWRSGMSPVRQAAVTALAFPIMSRYGYPIRPRFG